MPQWVEDCVRKYKEKGSSEEEARKRCHGAYEKRKKRRGVKKPGG